MDPSLRVVMQLPLSELWDKTGVLELSKIRELRTAEISELLRAGRVQFVVSNCGEPLKWIDPSDCYDFWKSEVRNRIVESDKFYLEDFPDQRCFVASEWSGNQPIPVILLETYH